MQPAIEPISQEEQTSGERSTSDRATMASLGSTGNDRKQKAEKETLQNRD